MGECRGGDCLIKLFGTTIPVPEAGDAKDLQHDGSGGGSSSSSTESNTHQQDALDPPPQSEVVDAEDPKTSPEPREQRPGGEEAASHGREKLKKPDKVLPCPRCSSMDTKFCYFNNYNVNQPRHFCKNCQRYWTAGGAMRNVPVGAGRRKNKNAAAAAASRFLQKVRAALPAGGDPLRCSGSTVLSFGQGVQAAADLAGLKEKLLVPTGNKSVGPCSEGSRSRVDDKNLMENEVAAAVDVHKHAANGVQQHPANMWPPYGCAPSQAYYPPGIAIPIFPSAPAYWGCMVPGAWTTLPWPAEGLSSLTSAPSVSSAGADPLALGKHARDGGGDEGRRSRDENGKVWAPKTIRIDDADEVARSSIWSLVGTRGDTPNTDPGAWRKCGTAFESKHETMTAKQALITSSPLLHANPVALTRSLTFQEGA